jgi:hypothetical protein
MLIHCIYYTYIEKKLIEDKQLSSHTCILLMCVLKQQDKKKVRKIEEEIN